MFTPKSLIGIAKLRCHIIIDRGRVQQIVVASVNPSLFSKGVYSLIKLRLFVHGLSDTSCTLRKKSFTDPITLHSLPGANQVHTPSLCETSCLVRTVTAIITAIYSDFCQVNSQIVYMHIVSKLLRELKAV